MTLGIDEFALNLLEEAKRFWELAKSSNEEAFLHAALLLAFSSLEAHINAISDDFSDSPELTLHERALLQEKEVRLVNGTFAMSNSLRMSRLEDRVDFLFSHFAMQPPPKDGGQWRARLTDATKLRNQLTHPKEALSVTLDGTRRAIQAIVDTLDAVYLSVYKRRFPSAGLGLDSRLEF